MSGVPQGSALGIALFNISINIMDSGMEFTLSKFANDAAEGRDTTERDPDKLKSGLTET